MSDITKRTLKGTGVAIQRVIQTLQYVDESKVVYVTITIAQTSGVPHNYEIKSQTLHVDNISQHDLGLIQIDITQHLWNNAHTHSGKVPWWSQPPRIMHSFKWHDLVLLGVTLGVFLGSALAALHR
jgi:hypothetical protein